MHSSLENISKGWDGILFISRGNYKGGQFKFVVEFPDEFPTEMPQVIFVTPVYHCFVSEEGRVALPSSFIWTPSTNLIDIIKIVKAMLLPPDSSAPGRILGYSEDDFEVLNPTAKDLAKTPIELLQRISECVERSRREIESVPTSCPDFTLNFQPATPETVEKVKEEAKQFSEKSEEDQLFHSWIPFFRSLPSQ